MGKMRAKNRLIASLAGTAMIALCCFTPVLVFSLGLLGLGAWVGYLDLVLLPAMGVMIGVTLWSYWRYRRSRQCDK